MNLGIRGKLFLLALGLVTAVLLAADLLLTRSVDRMLTERTRADLLTRAAVAEARAAGLPGDLSALVRDLGRRAQARLTLVGRDGRVLADSEVPSADLAALENHGGRPEVRAALAGGSGTDVRHSATLGVRMMYVAVPLGPSAAPAGALRLALPLEEVDAAVARFRGLLVGASLAALAFAALLASLAVNWAARPLRQLTATAARLVAGDGGAPSPSTGDELATLGRSLDRLAGDLAGALERVRVDHRLLEATFAGMQEGVMVVSAEGRILQANPALREFLPMGGDPLGRPLLEVLRHARLAELLEEARRQPGGAGGELEVEGLKPRRLQVQASPLPGQPGDLLVVLVDVTQLRHLESVRRDFVANASHELRTPVASIRSAAETLRGAQGDPEAREAFLGIIERNADRLHRLVDDLLDLSRIEAREVRLEPRPLALGPFLEGLAEAFAAAAAARDMRLEVGPALAALEVHADRRALEQVVGNLLDNALKYGAAGTAVRLDGGLEGGRVRLAVTDSGPGIDPQHLPRLFERFYRVDAGRSRDLGGTGLGLAIVKNLLDAMGGAVTVDSRPGEGSTFTVTLPSRAA